MNKLDMAGRGAVVTGGASGIGYAIAQRLAASGANVAIWDMAADLDAKAKSLGTGKHIGIKVDVTKIGEVEAAMKKSIAALGKVDAMVNSAGVAGKNSTVAEYPIDEWLRVCDINLNGVFYCCRTVAPHMTANNYGRIVNIASIAGKEGNPNASAYSASKAGVISLTKSLGKELAKSGIRVNCVTPAAVKTGMFAQMTQAHIDFMLSKIPMARFGQVEEIAALVAWLCTEDCSFSTGAVFDLSGGRAVY